MSLYTDLEQFLQAHRQHGQMRYETSDPIPKGYGLTVTCPCGIVFERRVLPEDAEQDLLSSGLSAFEN